MKQNKKIVIMRFSKIIIIPLILIYSSLGYANNLIINEIMYNPNGNDSDREWVELYNKGTTEINLTGWKFFDGSNHTLTIYQGTLTVPPEGYIILANNGVTFTSIYSTITTTIIQTPMTLNNTEDTIAIIDSSNIQEDSVTYTSTSGGNDNDKTLERISPDGNQWGESQNALGTPGQRNSITPTTALIKVYPVEIHARVDGTYTFEIRIENVTNLLGWQTSIYFNQAILQLITVEEGNFLKGNDYQTFWRSPDFGTGSIKNIACARIGTLQGASGSGTLASIKFKVIGSSTTSDQIKLEYVTLSGIHGISIPISVENGNIAIMYGFDLNNDGKINIQDLIIVGEIFGVSNIDKEYDSWTDINLDGKIDLNDLAIISLNFSEAPDSISPQVSRLYNLEQNRYGIIKLCAPTTTYEIGEVIDLDLVIEWINDLYGIQFEVEFDPNILSLIGANEGEFLKEDKTFNTFWVKSQKSPKNFAQCRIGKVNGVSGQGRIAKLKFKSNKSGEAKISINQTLALTPQLNKIIINPVEISLNISSSSIIFPKVSPNPSLNGQPIMFNLPSKATIELYTLSGELIKRLHPDGKDFVEWNLTNEDNNPIASGIYVYIININNDIFRGKIGIIR